MVKNQKAKRFISAYNLMDQGLRSIYGMGTSMSYSDVIRKVAEISPIIRKYKDELLDYGRLRNAIVHKEGEVIIADPNEDVVEKLESIARLVTKPPRVVDSVPNRQVFTVDANTPVSNVIQDLFKTGYSIVPVYRNKILVGVINRKMLIDSVGETLLAGVDLETTLAKPVLEVLDLENITSHYEVVASSITIDNMLYLFNQNRKLSVAIITKNGTYEEQPIGIVTSADVLDMQSILDNY
jgi:CBS domain-containing protein